MSTEEYILLAVGFVIGFLAVFIVKGYNLYREHVKSQFIYGPIEPDEPWDRK